MSDIMMETAIRGLSPLLAGSSRFEIIGTVGMIFWLIGGLANDPYLFLFSLIITVGTYVILLGQKLTPGLKIVYDIHSGSSRRFFVGLFAYWAYTAGRRVGPDTFDFFGTSIPIRMIAEWSLIGFGVIWFGTRYMNFLQDGSTPDTLIPLLLARGIVKGGILAGLYYALFVRGDVIPVDIQIPYLYGLYLLEPVLNATLQNFNRTYSTAELTIGNARLPAVALRESFISNFFILWFTMMFNGVSGEEWQLLRALYLIGAGVMFVYSYTEIKRFKENPLGKDILGQFLGNASNNLANVDLSQRFGHVMETMTDVRLSKDTEISIDPGAVIVPLEKYKGKINTLIIGRSQTVVERDGQRIPRVIDGVTTALIDEKRINSLTKSSLAQRLSELDLQSLDLPDLEQLQQYVGILAGHFKSWVAKVADQLSTIDLSNYGVTTDGPNTMVNLPGIMVNETPELTTVRVMGIRVFDGKKATTVRIGNVLTVVDLPKADYVRLPGITVLDINGVGTAVSIFGFKVSDGIPAEKLEEFKIMIEDQLNNWELGLSSQLGRMLADRSATGVMALDFNGDFVPMLSSNQRTMGTHPALAEASSPKQLYLPSDLGEQREPRQVGRFEEMTGLLPESTTDKPKKALDESDEDSQEFIDVEYEPIDD